MAASDPITAALNIGNTLIERFTDDPELEAQQKFKLAELAQAGDLDRLKQEVSLISGQLKINEAEAKNPHWFVSGWRPFIGWICGFALAYASIIEPFMRFVAVTLFGYKGDFPVMDTTTTFQILGGMLGLAGYRTIEKSKGVDTLKINASKLKKRVLRKREDSKH